MGAEVALPAKKAKQQQHTSDTFRPLLKKLALSFDLGLLSSSSQPSKHAVPNGITSSPQSQPAEDENYPSRTRPPGPTLSTEDLLDLFEHMADLNFTSSHANSSQIGAALTSLRMTGLDRDPKALAIASQVFLRSCLRIQEDGSTPASGASDAEYDGLLDIVGTGGDGQDTFNVSTTAAIVASGVPGIRVCKHGAKASSSTSGSVDLLLSLGIPLARLPPSSLSSILSQSSFAFLYAQLFHPSLGPLAPIRRALAFPTLFNVLGPLINPAQPRRCVLGVHSYSLGRTFAEALRQRGTIQRAWIVCGREGLDEISCQGPTDVWELFPDGSIKEKVIQPSDFGLSTHPLAHVGSYSSDENAAIVKRILSTPWKDLPSEPLAEPSALTEAEEASFGDGSGGSGSGKTSPPIPAGARLRAIADYTLLQASALLYVAGKATTLPACVELAKTAMQDGSARDALATFRRLAASEIDAAELKAELEQQRKDHEQRMQRRVERAATTTAGDVTPDSPVPDALAARQRQQSADKRAELQDSFSYVPAPVRDANVGTED